MNEMKKDKKHTVLIIAAVLILLLAGCGNSDVVTEEPPGKIEGQTVSYGPITITLPKEYEVKEKYPDCPVYYAMDAAGTEGRPTIRFLTKSETVTSNADKNKEKFIDDTNQLLESMEDSELKEVVSYEETELGGYKVIKVLTKEVVYGSPYMVGYYDIYEKAGSPGTLIRIKYDGLESDTGHLADFEACFDSISLKPEMNDTESLWQRIFYFKSGSDGNPLIISGNYAEYGPIHMMLPDGYIVEDDTEGEPVFTNSDDASFGFKFTEGSYQLMADQAYAEKLFQEELARTGITDVNLIHYEAIRISGYDGYEAFIQADKNGESHIEYIYVIFETADEVTAPAFMVTYAASEEVAGNMAEDVDTVFNSVRLVNE